MDYLKSKKAFTLVELLIVVGIIAILSGVVIAFINPRTLRGKARDGVRRNDMALIKGALEQYYAEHNEYPNAILFGSPWAGYLQQIPVDPLGATATPYCYTPDPANLDTPQLCVLCACMENADNGLEPTNGLNNCETACNTSYAGSYCINNPF